MKVGDLVREAVRWWQMMFYPDRVDWPKHSRVHWLQPPLEYIPAPDTWRGQPIPDAATLRERIVNMIQEEVEKEIEDIQKEQAMAKGSIEEYCDVVPPKGYIGALLRHRDKFKLLKSPSDVKVGDTVRLRIDRDRWVGSGLFIDLVDPLWPHWVGVVVKIEGNQIWCSRNDIDNPDFPESFCNLEVKNESR